MSAMRPCVPSLVVCIPLVKYQLAEIHALLFQGLSTEDETMLLQAATLLDDPPVTIRPTFVVCNDFFLHTAGL